MQFELLNDVVNLESKRSYRLLFVQETDVVKFESGKMSKFQIQPFFFGGICDITKVFRPQVLAVGVKENGD